MATTCIVAQGDADYLDLFSGGSRKNRKEFDNDNNKIIREKKETKTRTMIMMMGADDADHDNDDDDDNNNNNNNKRTLTKSSIADAGNQEKLQTMSSCH